MPYVRFVLLSAALLLVGLHATTVSAKKIDGDRLLAPDHLLDVRIKVAKADWDTLRMQARNPGAFFGGGTVEENPYKYFPADIWIDGIKIKSVGIRKKGLFGSTDSDRPSLKVKFDEYDAKQDPIKGLSRLTLNNNKQDRSQLSQFLAYKLFRDAGVHAPRCNLARVTVNGTYLGIYSHVESIKKPFLARQFGDKSGNLYEGTLTDFHPKTIDKLEVKTNQKTNDRSDLKQLVELLATDGDLQLAELEQIIDVDNFIRYWALEGLTRFWDGYASNQNNYFLYMNPTNGRGYFIPWGADWTHSTEGPFARFNNQGNTAVYAQGILAHRLYKTSGVPERYRQTMRKLLDEVWNEDVLLGEVDRLEALTASHLHPSQQDTAAAIEKLRGFIKSRRGELQNELQDWPATIPDQPRKPMYTVAVGQATGSFKTTWSQSAPQDASRAGSADLQLTLDGEVIEFEQIGVAAFANQFRGFGGFGGRGGGRPGPGPPGNFKPPVNVNFTGLRRDNKPPITLSLSVDADSFSMQSGEALDVTGRLTEGQASGFGFGFGGGRSLNGKLRLTKSGTTVGDAVVGSFALTVVEVHGGFFNQRQPPRGPGTGGRPQGAPGFGAPFRSGPPAIMRILDKNSDGVLSAEEIQAAPTALEQLDRNNDGEVSVDELTVPPRPTSDNR